MSVLFTVPLCFAAVLFLCSLSYLRQRNTPGGTFLMVLGSLFLTPPNPQLPFSLLVKPQEEEQKQEEEEEEEEDGRPQPHLGGFMVSETHSDSVRLSWTVPTGSFDSFLVQYEDGEDDIQTLPVDGVSRDVTVLNLIPSQRYRFELFGISKGKRLGPVSTHAVTGQQPICDPT